jgi:hypothetical protein
VEQFRKTGVQPISAAEVASAIVLGDVSTHCNPPLAAPPARVSSTATTKAKAEPEVPVVILDETDEKDEDKDASLIITNIVEAKDKSNAEEERTIKRKHEQVEETKEGFLTSLRRTTGSETQPQPKKRRLVQDPDSVTSDQKRKATTLRSNEDGDEDDGVDTNKRAKAGMATVGDRNVREEEEEEEHQVVTEKEAAGKDDLGEAEAEEPKPKEPPVERLMVTANKRLLARPLQPSCAPNFKKFSKVRAGSYSCSISTVLTTLMSRTQR